MAKKQKEEFQGGIGSLMSLVNSFDKDSEIIASSSYSNIEDWISTGNYILNACMSGDIYKAVPTGRVVTFAGTSGAGKSFLACSVCREAQKKGYIPIYLDSEGAIDSAFVKRLGVDPNNMIIRKVNTILETSQFIAELCDKLQEKQEKTGQHDKVIIVLDSLGNLTSDKEREDTIAGAVKADFTKAKDTKAMFRVCATPIAKLQIPWIVVNHVYQCCFGDTEILMENGEFKYLKDVNIGDKVLTLDGINEITNKFEFNTKKYYELTFEDGYVLKCTDKHKLMVKDKNGELIYKTAQELTDTDELVIQD